MADMLVKLYKQPSPAALLAELAARGVEIQRAAAADGPVVVDWVRRRFHDRWARECGAAFAQRPVTCFVAGGKPASVHAPATPYNLPPRLLLGFACYDVTAKGMFGPQGVQEDHRGMGIGKALLLACLHAMMAEGYGYAVIGWAGPKAFYERVVGATVIEGSEPGMYRGPLIGEMGDGWPGNHTP